jgi:cell division protein FtsN
MRNKRRDRKKGNIHPVVLGGLVVLFLSILLLAYLDFEKADKGGGVGPELAGRMVISDSPKAKTSSVQEETPVGPSARKGVKEKTESVLGTSFDQDVPTQKVTRDSPEEKSQGEFTFYKSLGENLVGLGDPSKIHINGLNPKAQKPDPKPKKSIEIQPQKESVKIYTIQVAAFRDKIHADALIQQLKEKGFPAYLQIKDGERGPDWYRVRVGEFPGKEEASQKAKHLQGGGGFPPFVTLYSN